MILATNRGAAARALALSFNRKAGIVAPSLALLPQVIQALRLGLLAFIAAPPVHLFFIAALGSTIH